MLLSASFIREMVPRQQPKDTEQPRKEERNNGHPTRFKWPGPQICLSTTADGKAERASKLQFPRLFGQVKDMWPTVTWPVITVAARNFAALFRAVLEEARSLGGAQKLPARPIIALIESVPDRAREEQTVEPHEDDDDGDEKWAENLRELSNK